jgi:hypothetical protein
VQNAQTLGTLGRGAKRKRRGRTLRTTLESPKANDF